MHRSSQHRPQPSGAPRATREADRHTTHQRQLAYVRASLQRGVAYAPAAGRRDKRP